MAALLSISDGGTRRQIIASKVMDLGVLRTLRTAKVLDDDALRTVANFIPPLSVSANNVDAFTNPSYASTARPAGGAGPFTYSWAVLSGDLTANFPTNASTTFSTPGFFQSGTAHVIVTDALGSTAFTDISISISFAGETP